MVADNRLQQVTKQLKACTEEEMFAACGYGGIPVSTVLLRLIELYKKSKEAEESKRSTEQILEKLKSQGQKKTKNGNWRPCKRRSWCYGADGKMLQSCTW